MSKEITLSKGHIALVDEADFTFLNKIKWYPCKNWRTFYALTRRNGTMVGMHTIILGKKENHIIDHINGNGLDNRRCNLRFSTRQQNSLNRRKNKNSSYRYKGIKCVKEGKKWSASITFNRVRIYLGTFSHEEEAAWAYDCAARKLHGEFCKLNFKDEKDFLTCLAMQIR